MLDVLFGSKNIVRILLFLFVNNKCYGTQLHRCLKTSLTPLQKALSRLEFGGLIISYLEGKTKVYQFNPHYSLLAELEALLKKAYTLLPAAEKKNYYVIKQDAAQGINQTRNAVVLTVWEKLKVIKQLKFNASHKANSLSAWNGNGQGDVHVKQEKHVLIFNEKGSWQGKEGQEVIFSNVFRWTLDQKARVISLEHLRYGQDRPVFLFHLAPAGKNSLSSVDAHLCEGDAYFGQLHIDAHTLRLNWRVIGPKKNEEIDYYYS